MLTTIEDFILDQYYTKHKILSLKHSYDKCVEEFEHYKYLVMPNNKRKMLGLPMRRKKGFR